MDKENWRKSWLSSINELTSIELQRKTWLNNENTNPHWSFIEFIECYFDELRLDDFYDDALRIGFVTNQEFETIKVWHKKITEYNSPNEDDHNHTQILADPLWIDIVKNGEDVKFKLAEIINQEEREILLEQKNVA